MSLPNHFQTQIHLRWDPEEYFIPTYALIRHDMETPGMVSHHDRLTSLFYLPRPSRLLDIDIIPQHSRLCH